MKCLLLVVLALSLGEAFQQLGSIPSIETINTNYRRWPSNYCFGSVRGSWRWWPTNVDVRVNMPSTHRQNTNSNTMLHYKAQEGDDSEEFATHLNLSAEDKARMKAISDRLVFKLPIMIIEEVLLPGQTLKFGSYDPKFHTLVEEVLSSEHQIIGLVAVDRNHQNIKPMNVGVVVSIDQSSIIKKSNGLISIDIKAQERFQITGDGLFFDQTQSFYYGNIELIDRKTAEMSVEDSKSAYQYFQAIPGLVDTLLTLVIIHGQVSREDLDLKRKHLGDMPNSIGKSAVWVAALLDNLQLKQLDSSTPSTYNIGQKILECESDFNKISTAFEALNATIESFNGV